MVKVSSITYVKNGEKYIEQCIRSVMNQTLKEIEIIVVDGESTDATPEILKRLSEEDERIRLFKCAGSVGAQFNCGLKAASGVYIGVCEGDDYIPENKYEVLYDIAEKNWCNIVKATYRQIVYVKGKEYGWAINYRPEEMLEHVMEAGSQEDLFLRLGVDGFWSGIYERSFLLEHGIFMNETKGAAYQDITFSFLSQLYAKRCYFLREPLHNYRLDNEEASTYASGCIETHYTEYGLLQKILKERQLWNRYKDIFLAWELVSYKHFCNETAREIRNKKIHEVYEHLHRQIKDNDIRMTEDCLEMKDIYEALMEGEDAFRAAVLKDDDRDSRMLAYFRGRFYDEEKVAIFGAGHIGEILCTYARLQGKEILMIDNGQAVQVAGCCGEKVYPADVVRQNRDLTYLVANYKYGGAIREQLLDMGIAEERIILCQNEDCFLRRIFAGVKNDER